MLQKLPTLSLQPRKEHQVPRSAQPKDGKGCRVPAQRGLPATGSWEALSGLIGASPLTWGLGSCQIVYRCVLGGALGHMESAEPLEGLETEVSHVGVSHVCVMQPQ